MNGLQRVEAWCAAVVERFFARVFPGTLEPVQIARRLVATLERDPPPADALRPSRYVARVSTADFARLAEERAFLEGQWAKMATALCERAGIRATHAPLVELVADHALVSGTVVIDVDRPSPEEGEADSPLQLRVEAGLDAGTTYLLPEIRGVGPGLVLGRDPGCDIVVLDPRVSRRHVRILGGADGLRFEDLGSSNGTYVNGTLQQRGGLKRGDRLDVGDTTLAIEAAAAAARR